MSEKRQKNARKYIRKEWKVSEILQKGIETDMSLNIQIYKHSS